MVAGACCVLMLVVLMLPKGRYFCVNCCGGGNSKFGRFEAADRRAVRLDPTPDGSRFEVIPECCTGAFDVLYWPSRFCPGGLKTSVSAVGGVGRVDEGGMEPAGVDAVAPGQNWPACAAWLLEKSREGNLYLKAEAGVVGSS